MGSGMSKGTQKPVFFLPSANSTGPSLDPLSNSDQSPVTLA